VSVDSTSGRNRLGAIQAPEARMNVQTAHGHLPALRRAAAELAQIFQDK